MYSGGVYVPCIWANDKRSYKKNGTVHSKFQLRNLTKMSEFNKWTNSNNYLQKKKLQKKQLQQNHLSEHDIFPAAMAIENQLW